MALFRLLFLIFLCLFANLNLVFSQFNCLPSNSEFNFTPTALSKNKFIDWDKFPEFSLPFKIIYNGPRFGDKNQQPLKHGFSHLSAFSGPDSATLPIKNRALIYYGVAYNFPNPQPWQLIRSPWGNDLAGYRKKWQGEMFAYSYLFNETRGQNAPATDIMIIDVERHWEGQFTAATDFAILGIKNNELVPKEYSQLSDNQFIDRYKKDMLNLYALPIEQMRKDGLLSKFNRISSYGDVPIRYQGLNIEANQWTDWQTNTNRLSYLMKDTLTNKLGGPFESQMDFLCPSIYLQADYAANPKARGGNYLAEALFQIEVNAAWSKKELWPFLWLRYEDFSLPYPRWIKPYQAEAMAIFPFMAGAKGAVLWEDSFQNIEATNFATFEYYINGLYKLSQYKSFFEGNYELVQEHNARDLFTNQLPVWRGVVKDGKILVAAQNPYAAENETTILKISHKKWSNTITLKGREVFLCAFNYLQVTGNENEAPEGDFVILKNPIESSQINLKFNSKIMQSIDFQLFDNMGKSIYKENYLAKIGENNYQRKLIDLEKGIYFLKILTGNGLLTKKIIN